MQGLRFLCKQFNFLQRFKHALPIIDYKFAWKMQGIRFLRIFKYALMEFGFQKNCVSLFCASYLVTGAIKELVT